MLKVTSFLSLSLLKLLAYIVFFVSLFFILVAVTFEQNISNPEIVIEKWSFEHEIGNCYFFHKEIPKLLSIFYTGKSDIDEIVSKLKLYENDIPLGPAHRLHDDIRKKGEGRYSDWGTVVYFSSSDNTDPNTNKRKYKIVFPLFLHSYLFKGSLVVLLIFTGHFVYIRIGNRITCIYRKITNLSKNVYRKITNLSKSYQQKKGILTNISFPKISVRKIIGNLALLFIGLSVGLLLLMGAFNSSQVEAYETYLP